MYAGMSATGSDIFFETRSQLVGQDTDSLGDIYDARVDGGFPAPTPEPSCSGEACQGTQSSAPTSGLREVNRSPEAGTKPPPHSRKSLNPKPNRSQSRARVLRSWLDAGGVPAPRQEQGQAGAMQADRELEVRPSKTQRRKERLEGRRAPFIRSGRGLSGDRASHPSRPFLAARGGARAGSALTDSAAAGYHCASVVAARFDNFGEKFRRIEASVEVERSQKRDHADPHEGGFSGGTHGVGGPACGVPADDRTERKSPRQQAVGSFRVDARYSPVHIWWADNRCLDEDHNFLRATGQPSPSDGRRFGGASARRAASETTVRADGAGDCYWRRFGVFVGQDGGQGCLCHRLLAFGRFFAGAAVDRTGDPQPPTADAAEMSRARLASQREAREGMVRMIGRVSWGGSVAAPPTLRLSPPNVTDRLVDFDLFAVQEAEDPHVSFDFTFGTFWPFEFPGRCGEFKVQWFCFRGVNHFGDSVPLKGIIRAPQVAVTSIGLAPEPILSNGFPPTSINSVGHVKPFAVIPTGLQTVVPRVSHS